jgi:hypothetical protein
MPIIALNNGMKWLYDPVLKNLNSLSHGKKVVTFIVILLSDLKPHVPDRQL